MIESTLGESLGDRMVWEFHTAALDDYGEPGFYSTLNEDGAEVLAWYADDGRLCGVVVYEPCELFEAEVPAQFVFVVHPDRRRCGVGLTLLREADRRYALDFEGQDYTKAGAACVNAYLASRG